MYLNGLNSFVANHTTYDLVVILLTTFRNGTMGLPVVLTDDGMRYLVLFLFLEFGYFLLGHLWIAEGEVVYVNHIPVANAFYNYQCSSRFWTEGCGGGRCTPDTSMLKQVYTTKKKKKTYKRKA